MSIVDSVPQQLGWGAPIDNRQGSVIHSRGTTLRGLRSNHLGEADSLYHKIVVAHASIAPDYISTLERKREILRNKLKRTGTQPIRALPRKPHTKMRRNTRRERRKEARQRIWRTSYPNWLPTRLLSTPCSTAFKKIGKMKYDGTNTLEQPRTVQKLISVTR